MADKNKDDGPTLLKYRFVEEFPESIDPETGKPYEDIDSPKVVETELWGKIELHQIAKIKWTESVVIRTYEDSNGKEEEIPIRIYEQEMGEIGGWIEKKANLDQNGKCWVEKGACVVGDAYVYGDAIIGKDAEIGDLANVGGEAKVSGPVGVGEEAHVLGKAKIGGSREELEDDVDEKWKKGMKRKRIAVGGHATVKGEVVGTSKVFDEAYVDEYATISGEAKVYGNSYVGGTEKHPASVKDKAKVYGYAKVDGTIKDKAEILGVAHIGEEAVIGDSISLRNGIIYGEISGDFLFRGLYLFLGKGSKIICEKKEERGKKYYPKKVEESPVKILKTYATSYGTDGETDVIKIDKKCIIKYCLLAGKVTLENTNVSYSKISDSEIRDSTVDFSTVSYSRLKDARIDGGTLSHAQTEGQCKLLDCTITHGVIPEKTDWEDVSLTGITNVQKAKGLWGFYPMSTGVASNDMIEKGKKEKGIPLAYEHWPETGTDYIVNVSNSSRYNVLFWQRYSRRYYTRNFDEKDVAGVRVILKARRYDAAIDPPIYDPPGGGSFLLADNETKRKYDESFEKRLRDWWLVHTKSGQKQAKLDKRELFIKKLTDPLFEEADKLKDAWEAEKRYRRSALYDVIYWVKGNGTLNRPSVTEEVWDRESDFANSSVEATSGTWVNVTSPFKLTFVTNETGEQEYCIPDFSQEMKIPSFSDSQSHIYVKVDGMHVSAQSKGHYIFDKYDHAFSWYYTLTLNSLFHLIEFYGGAVKTQQDQEKIEAIDTKAIDEKISHLEWAMNELVDEGIDETGAHYFFISDPDKYYSLGRQLDAAIKEWENLVGWDDMMKKEEEYRQKRERDWEIEQSYQKRWKDTVEKDRDHAKLRKSAISYVRSCLWGAAYTDDNQATKKSAKELRDILQKLMYENPGDDEIKQLRVKAEKAEEQNNKAWAEFVKTHWDAQDAKKAQEKMGNGQE